MYSKKIKIIIKTILFNKTMCATIIDSPRDSYEQSVTKK